MTMKGTETQREPFEISTHNQRGTYQSKLISMATAVVLGIINHIYEAFRGL